MRIVNYIDLRNDILFLLGRSRPQKLLAKNWENDLINEYDNFFIDPSCLTELWFVWLTSPVQEWVEVRDDLRQRKKDPVYR